MEKKKKRFGVGIILLIGLVLALSVLAARLPVNGQDSGAWGTLLNGFLDAAHDTGGNIKSGYITTTMIADNTIAGVDILDNTIAGVDIANATIEALDIAASAVNTTHILDNTILGVDIANATIEAIDIAASAVNTTHILDNTITGADISTATNVNVSNLVVAGANSTIAISSGFANITGIFFNITSINLPSDFYPSGCKIVPINITGIPAGVSCIAVGDPNMGPFNVSIHGVNSTVDNCRIAVCNLTAAPDLPELAFGAFGIATGLNWSTVGPAG